MTEDTKEDQTITLYFSQMAKDQGPDQRFDDVVSCIVEIPDGDGGTKKVEFTGLCEGEPELAAEKYPWDDKYVVWSGPRSKMVWLEQKTLDINFTN